MSPEVRRAELQKLLLFYLYLGGHSKPWNKLPQDTVNSASVESSKEKWTRWSWEVPFNLSDSVKDKKIAKCCITNNFDYSDCINHQDNPRSIQTPAQCLGTAKN